MAGEQRGHRPRAASGPAELSGLIAIWKRDFSGASGIFSFALAGGWQAHAFLDALEIFGLGFSLGQL